jgi:Lrp/AsnC family transcriptional regulator, leucine-responsive regulatory protein
MVKSATDTSQVALFDSTDRRILREIQSDGRMPVVELAERVNLSKSPCLKRLRRLEKDGYINGYRAELDPKKLGYGYLVFVQVTLVNTTRITLEAFNRAMQDVPQIEGCYMMAGGYDYLLKVRTKDMDDYRLFLGEILSGQPGIGQTSTFPVMEEVKTHSALEI